MKHLLLFSLLLSLGLVACKTGQTLSRKTGGSESLFMYRWILADVGGKPVAGRAERIPEVLFTPGQVGFVRGAMECNKFSGTFDLQADHTIRFADIQTTERPCPDAKVEPLLMEAILTADGWSIDGAVLYLVQGNQILARFTGQAESGGK